LACTPSVVRRWTNFAERRDPIAFDTRLAGDYRANVAGVQVVDDLVLNDTVTMNGMVDYHNILGYLRTPELSRIIRQFV
jgi:hypothetical protein